MVVIIALLVERYLSNRQVIKERDDLIRGILARDATEYKNTSIHTPVDDSPQEPDFTPIEELSDDEFFNKINGKEDKQ